MSILAAASSLLLRALAFLGRKRDIPNRENTATYIERYYLLFPHRLEVVRQKVGSETWTLFFVGRRVREWGFVNDAGEWVQWDQHLYGTPDPQQPSS